MSEQEEEIQGQGQEVSPSPVSCSPTMGERVTYISSAVGVGGGLAALIGMGSISFAIATIAGVGGGFFAEEIHETLAKRRKGVKLSQHRFANMDFWLRGSQDTTGIETEPLPTITDEENVRARDVEAAFHEEIQQLEPIFPLYPAWQTLKLGQAIDKESQTQLSDAYTESLKTGKRVNVAVPGRRFDPHFNALFGKGIIAAANQGFGKSMLNGVTIEQAGMNGVPTVVLDHKGEYVGVKELPFMNAWIAGACDTHTAQVDFVLTAENAAEFVEQVMQHRYQAIINLPSYGSSWVERAKIVAVVGKALMDYAQEQLKTGGTLLPCLVIVDEAQLYFPQDRSYLPAEARKNQEVLDNLSSSYFSLVSNGRSNGYTMCFSTQSLTYVAKSLIKSCQIRLLGRHCEKNDLDMCEEIISRSVATRQDIETLPPGVFVVFGFTQKPMVVQFDTKQSRDLSETPGIERLREPQQRNVQSRQPVQRLPDLAMALEEDDTPITFEELCDAVFEMAMARDSDSEIMRQLDLSREEYVNIATYIKTHRSEFRSTTPEVPQTVKRPNLSVVPSVSGTPGALLGASANAPQYSVNEPVEPSEFDFVQRDDDLILTELQVELLKVFYQKCGNVNKSLEQIRDERGRGLGGRYTRHASFVLEQAGLKKKRA